MPLNIDIIQILLHIFNFLLLAGGLTLILYKPMKKFMDGRREEIENRESESRESLEAARRMKAEYEEKLKTAEAEADGIKRRAETEAAEEARKYVESARNEAAEILRSAEIAADERRENILESAQTDIGELIIGAAQKLLGDTASPERSEELYDGFIKYAQAGSGDKTGADPGKDAGAKK